MAVQRMLILSLVGAVSSQIHLNVTNKIGTALSPQLHGLILDEQYHSIEGGLSAQELENPGLIGDVTSIWTAINDRLVAEKDDTPLTDAIASTLKLSGRPNASGLTGITNRAYGGFEVTPVTNYITNFHIQGAFQGNMTFELVNLRDGSTLKNNRTIAVDSEPGKFTEYTARFQTKGITFEHPPGLYSWRLVFDASLLAGKTIHIGYPTLTGLKNDVGPFTWVEDKAGVSPMVSDPIYNLEPNFIRFPGGQNLQGSNPENRWKWNETIGLWINRPGRTGVLPYPSSDEVGLMEFLGACGTTFPLSIPVLQIWSGFSPDSLSSSVVTGSALQPYVDDALAELEFILGDSGTPGGRLRAKYGQKDPFRLRFVEIGYEDDRNGGCASYPERLQAFYTAIRRIYPSLQIIASTSKRECLPSPLPSGIILNYRAVLDESQLVEGYHLFDQFDAANPLFVEYSSPPEQSGFDQTLKRAAAEAVFMLGWERNSDVVKMGAYKTSIARGRDQQEVSISWHPGCRFAATLPLLIAFTAGSVQFQCLGCQRRDELHRPVTLLPRWQQSPAGQVRHDTRTHLLVVKHQDLAKSSQASGRGLD